jgi:hypothetical protein
MALNTRTDMVLNPYRMTSRPTLDNSQAQWVDEELKRIELFLEQVYEAMPQVADAAPDNPKRGMIRYATSPWNPLGSGDAWVFFNGTVWVAQ